MADMPNRLYELRRARGLSQQRLAELAGCSKMHVSGVERGTREFSLSLMRRFADVLGVTPADILSDKDNPDRLDGDMQRLVDIARQADEADREKILRVAEALSPFRQDPRNAA